MIIEMDLEYGGTPVGTSLHRRRAHRDRRVWGTRRRGIPPAHSMCSGTSARRSTTPSSTKSTTPIWLETPSSSSHSLGFGLPFDSEGELVDGQLTSDWEGSFSGFVDLTGTLDVTRLTREVTPL